MKKSEWQRPHRKGHSDASIFNMICSTANINIVHYINSLTVPLINHVCLLAGVMGGFLIK